mmetsp:Transcript_7816/g.18614  ORF Transcript_7816/g.18614 Transcript_7816/m.18614 type:complete len:87 (+) Transcript_7816:661-921(+)
MLVFGFPFGSPSVQGPTADAMTLPTIAWRDCATQERALHNRGTCMQTRTRMDLRGSCWKSSRNNEAASADFSLMNYQLTAERSLNS